jgi:hypothetical protein
MGHLNIRKIGTGLVFSLALAVYVPACEYDETGQPKAPTVTRSAPSDATDSLARASSANPASARPAVSARS